MSAFFRLFSGFRSGVLAPTCLDTSLKVTTTTAAAVMAVPSTPQVWRLAGTAYFRRESVSAESRVFRGILGQSSGDASRL